MTKINHQSGFMVSYLHIMTNLIIVIKYLCKKTEKPNTQFLIIL